MSLLAGWLGSLGLAQYLDVFVKNDIELGILPSLTEQDLAELGVSMGHRKRLLIAIGELAAVTGAAGALEPFNARPLATPLSSSSISGERRQLTVLFCDMVGFTELA